jgi:2-polyprenyl-3-methyl-5-hydroxy-6-metoxy-1,4-benzoquinol methylase
MRERERQQKPSHQRLDEWKKLDDDDYHYHKIQWDTPKRSTIAFEAFANEHIANSKNIIDMGAGLGAATATIAIKHSNVHFKAFDYSSELTNTGSKIAYEKGITNLSFEQGDWFNLAKTKKYDGCISLQTLSWLPDYRQPLEVIFRKINPNWLALTSLFYEGDITCRIEVEEHKKNKKIFYNVYSLPAISRLCNEEGYSLINATPFKIDIDIKKPDNLDIMTTYTRKLVVDKTSQERIQISGPLLMNWYMLLIKKN